MASTDRFRHYWTDEIPPNAADVLKIELRLSPKRVSGGQSLSKSTVQNELFSDYAKAEVPTPAQVERLVADLWTDLRKVVREVSESFFQYHTHKIVGTYFNDLGDDERWRVSTAITELPEYQIGGAVTRKYTRWLWDNRMKTMRSTPAKVEGNLHTERQSDLCGESSASLHLNNEQRGNVQLQLEMRRPDGEEKDLDDYTLAPLLGHHSHYGDYYQTR
ncbi:hypothetical protein TWF481_002793 [Arthrobotrys musiformis]|uniref:Uncharacterized protein n=1 Tax=Arthrobotrys musiformis TaxID=47236 RepID=A0AAV9VT75_9PEZI